MPVESQCSQTGPETASRTARAEAIGALAALYRLLGRCLEEEVDAELLRLLRGKLAGELARIGWTLDDDFMHRPESELLEALAEEYTGLFVAPGGVSPYASVFETGCMFREPCDRVTRAYQAAGWDYRRRLSGEFADHIGTMLGFIGELAAAEAQACQQGDMETAEQRRQQRETFLIDELGPWAPGWCQRAAQAALLPFYHQLLTFTEQFLWQELALLADRRKLKELVALNRREPKKLDYDADFRKASGI